MTSGKKPRSKGPGRRKRRKAQKPTPPRRRRSSSKLTEGQLAKSAEAAVAVAEADGLEKPKIRPVHWRYLRAKLDCLDAGQALTTVNHAKHAGVSRIALWKLQRKYPWLDAWCDEVMRTANMTRWGSIERRMATLAEQGHVGAADQYCKMQGGHYVPRGPRGGADDDESPEDSRFITHVNILVPHPQLPEGGRMPALSAPLVSLPQNLKDIPTVAVR